jgi:hypothetical protein
VKRCLSDFCCFSDFCVFATLARSRIDDSRRAERSGTLAEFRIAGWGAIACSAGCLMLSGAGRGIDTFALTGAASACSGLVSAGAAASVI